jgi:flagellar M-ring protein FliF
MDMVKKWMAQVQTQVTELSVSQKLLIGTLMLVIPMMLWVVVSYAGSSSMVPVLDQPMDDKARTAIIGYLQTNQIEFRQEGARIFVPAERRPAVIAQLALSNLLPQDTSVGFKKFLEAQSWWWSSDHRRNYFDIALQNHLSGVISEFPWVSHANVVISRPTGLAFARPKMRPTASINVTLESGRMNQRQVGSVAALVSGAVAEMRSEDVNVIDAVAGRSYNIESDMPADASAFLENVASLENYFRKKIENSFERSVPGVHVGINVDVDMVATHEETRTVSEKPFLTRTLTRSKETSSADAGGQPGVEANTSASIPGSSNGKMRQIDEEKSEEFTTHPGYKLILSRLPVGMPKRVTAVVHVPRTYFVSLYKERNPDADGEPTQQQLDVVILAERPFFLNTVKQVVPIKTDEEVYIATFSDTLPSSLGQMVAGEDAASWWSGSLMVNGVLIALAAFSLGIMTLMVRRAAAQPVPTPEELAGLPDMVGGEDPLMGEVAASEAALPGVELDEEAMQHQQLVDQVSDMTRSNPDDVTALVKWWMKHTA